jgi:tetratricopeptide (TPR) repeat protein
VSAAASAVWSLCATSGARRLAQRAVLLGSLVLLILATSDPTLVQAVEARDAALKASQGRAALVRGQYQEADGLFTEALQSAALAEATRVFSLNNRGLARWRLRELRAAVEDFNAALKLAPTEPTLYNNRGNVLLELRLYDEAEKDFGQAVALAPTYGAAHHNRGNALLLLGKPAEAIPEYSRAVSLLPQNPAPFNGRGKAQAALHRPAGAIRDLNRAIALNSRYGEAYGNRADAMATLHRYREALDDYTSAITFGAKTARIYLGRASVYRHFKKPGLALEDVAEAKTLDPSLDAAGLAPNEQDEAEADEVETADAPDTEGLCEDGHTAQEAEGTLAKLDNAASAGLKTALLLQTKSDAGATTAVMTSPCDPQDAADDDDDDDDQYLGPDIEDWTVEATPDGYVAQHLEYTGLKLTLEMYGSGEPELLHWQRLKGSLRSIGLLHYFAGTSAKGERLEYVALVNVYSGKVIAIEPCRWGEELASWTWSDTGVVVVDPQGVPSEVKVVARAEPVASTRPAKARRAKRAAPSRKWEAERPRPRRFNPYGRRFNPYAFGAWAYR